MTSVFDPTPREPKPPLHWRFRNLMERMKARDEYDTVHTALEALVHAPEYAFYLQAWVPYHGDECRQWRLKCCHDVRTKDGREFIGLYPNATSWTSFGGQNVKLSDDDVEFIRISKVQIGDEIGRST